MFVPASRLSLVRNGFLYNARTDGRKASQGIPALRTDAASARPDAPLARPDAPLAPQATTMPVEIGFDMRETIRAGSSPTAFINAKSRAGSFVIEIASSSDALLNFRQSTKLIEGCDDQKWRTAYCELARWPRDLSRWRACR
ncbi:MAG TPA: hypothetical protein VN831_30770 [Bradyrhizobium sp.]|nr:hypothetical protein [Bradyrhizobium sp.]